MEGLMSFIWGFVVVFFGGYIIYKKIILDIETFIDDYDD